MSTLRGSRGRGGSDGRGRGGFDDRGRGGFSGRGRGQGRGSADPLPAQFKVTALPGGLPDPSTKANAQENQTLSQQGTVQQSLGDISLATVSLEDRLPRRPGFGTKGKPVVLYANYFELQLPLSLVLHRYSITIEPKAVGRKLEQIVRLLLTEEESFKARQHGIASDFRSTLVTREKLPPMCLGDFKVQYRGELETQPQTNAPTYKLSVQDALRQHTVADLINYVTSTNINASYPDRYDMLQALNIILGDSSKRSIQVTTIGSNRSFAIGPQTPSFDLTGGLVALRGYFSSVRLATSRILVNINITHTAFYPPVGLVQLIRSCRMDGNLYRLAAFLKGLRVRTTHIRDRKSNGQVMPQFKSIQSLGRPCGESEASRPKVKRLNTAAEGVVYFVRDYSAPSSFRPSESTPADGGKSRQADGKENVPTHGPTPVLPMECISAFDYFFEEYGIDVKDHDLPLINIGTHNNPVYVPAEVCMVLPGQPYGNKISSAQTEKMIKAAVRQPWQNMESIANEGLRQKGFVAPANAQLQSFSIDLEPKPITVHGRILDPPAVKYVRDGKPSSIMPRSGSWNMQNIKFTEPKPLPLWGWVRLRYRSNKNDIDNNKYYQMPGLVKQMERLADAFERVGMRTAPPKKAAEILIDTFDDPQIEKLFDLASRNRWNLIYVILPSADSRLHNHIKRLGDLKYGVSTTCTLESTLAKQIDYKTQAGLPREIQLFTNIALKVNLILGGVNQTVDTASLPLVEDDKTMFVGIDVTHPTATTLASAPSIAAMVANVDKKMGQWPAALSIQHKARQEMVCDLEPMLKSRLVLWRNKHTGRLPENIMVYRDGVSDGQRVQVLEKELPLLRAACVATYPATDTKKGLPRITIVVVSKRHHTRFYPTATDAVDRGCNNLPGTVVDRGVTEARTWEFYMQAHAAIQGTARPAHYIVLLDEIFAGSTPGKAPDPRMTGRRHADTLEAQTLAMCHVFGRATKSVSYATPARYADMACERARQYLRTFDDDHTSSFSVVSGSEPGEGPMATTRDIQVAPRLTDKMFYI